MIDGEPVITDDKYDEGPLTGVSTIEIENKLNDDFLEETALHQEDELQQISQSSGISPMLASNYNPGKAVDYSNNYVYKSANGGTTYDQYYNSAYINFNSSGGDCANYVSQCLANGGLSFIGSGVSGTDKWWYNTSNSTYGGAWPKSSYMYALFSQSHTSKSSNLVDADIIPGNPVYYAWSGAAGIGHTTICAGYNSSGTPVVNSHNNDYYRVKWNYGGTGTKYATVFLTNDDVLDIKDADAKKVSDGTIYAKLNINYDVDVFRYVASAPRTFTISTSGSVFTTGRLYSSTAILLTSNSGALDGKNFKITYTLSVGQVYYIAVTGTNPPDYGFYELNIS